MNTRPHQLIALLPCAVAALLSPACDHSGECTPCTPIAFGDPIEVVRWDVDADAWLTQAELPLDAGGQYLFVTALDDGWPVVDGWVLNEHTLCSALDF